MLRRTGPSRQSLLQRNGSQDIHLDAWAIYTLYKHAQTNQPTNQQTNKTVILAVLWRGEPC